MYRLPSPFQHRAHDSTLSASSGGCTTSSCCCTLVTAGVSCIATAVLFASLTPSRNQSDAGTDPLPIKGYTGRKVALALLGFFALPVLLGLAIWLQQGVLPAVGGWFALFALVYATHQRKALIGMAVALACTVAMFAVGSLELWVWRTN